MKDIFKKELMRVFSDKKMIFSLFILPAIVMLGVYGLVGTMTDKMETDIEEHISVTYIQNAPEGFEALVAQTGYDAAAEIKYVATDASVEEVQQIKDDILNGAADLFVVFDKEFLAKAGAYQNAGDPIPSVKLGYNSTMNYSTAARSMFDAMVLDVYETNLLQNRFANLDLLTVFISEDELIINEDKANGAMLASMLPYFIIMLLFAGSMGLCVDAIAGEKERGTMATMLLSPVKRGSIVFGKLLGLSVLSALSSVVYAASMIVAMPKMMGDMGTVSFSGLQVVELLGIMISLVLFNVCVICMLSVFAKNSKEASAYVSPVYMVVVVLGMLTMFNVGGTTPANPSFAIPIYGSSLAIQAIATNELSLAQFGLSVGGNVLCVLVMVMVITRVFNNEKIMLNA